MTMGGVLYLSGGLDQNLLFGFIVFTGLLFILGGRVREPIPIDRAIEIARKWMLKYQRSGELSEGDIKFKGEADRTLDAKGSLYSYNIIFSIEGGVVPIFYLLEIGLYGGFLGIENTLKKRVREVRVRPKKMPGVPEQPVIDENEEKTPEEKEQDAS